jgi:hypothetical protein
MCLGWVIQVADNPTACYFNWSRVKYALSRITRGRMDHLRDLLQFLLNMENLDRLRELMERALEAYKSVRERKSEKDQILVDAYWDTLGEVARAYDAIDAAKGGQREGHGPQTKYRMPDRIQALSILTEIFEKTSSLDDLQNREAIAERPNGEQFVIKYDELIIKLHEWADTMEHPVSDRILNTEQESELKRYLMRCANACGQQLSSIGL